MCPYNGLSIRFVKMNTLQINVGSTWTLLESKPTSHRKVPDLQFHLDCTYWHISFYSCERGEQMTGNILYLINSSLPTFDVIVVHVSTGLVFLMVWQHEGNSWMFQSGSDSIIIWEKLSILAGMKTSSHYLVRSRKHQHEHLYEEYQQLRGWSSISSTLDAWNIQCGKHTASSNYESKRDLRSQTWNVKKFRNILTNFFTCTFLFIRV